MAHASEVARGELPIVGLGLGVDPNKVITAVDVPSYVQTFFGGKVGVEAPAAPGLSAVGELTGPGIDSPITLSTKPGEKFAIPALHEKGEYTLQNIRLAGGSGEFLQQAIPSAATIEVSEVLQTKVKVRQLTADELRERGIFIDARNYDVYEYTFIFGVDGSTVEIPYPVIIDRRTREIIPANPGSFGLLPFPKLQKPPRFSPPKISTFDLRPDTGDDAGGGEEREPTGKGIALPAALVVPNGFGVLHQFFAVILNVSNSAPEGSNIRLDSITARINSPLTMRVAKVLPAVSLGQPVPITDSDTGASFLVIGAEGKAEWTLEALKTGTHTVDIDVRATYQQPGQEDFGIGGRVSASIVVSDPRFHVNFSHPDVVRKDDKYTAFQFVTNLSEQRQHVFLDMSEVPACSTGSSANNVCRYEGPDRVELDIEPGEMITVPHKLISRVTGHVYAGAGSSSDETVGVSVRLFTGVSESGIPLSPATLAMPYHTRFLPTEFVDGNMQLLGLAYSLATAPLTKITARKPRVITTDVFQRAQQIALAGQRVFTTRKERDVNDAVENRDAFLHLSLDLLGNVERKDMEQLMPELSEYDELRRQEEAGRIAGAAMARQLETNNTTQTAQQFADDFAAATSHRTPYMFAYVHGPPVAGKPRPYALSVTGLSSQTSMDVPAEAASGWVRGLAYGEITRLNTGGDEGEMALVGRWSENLRLTVVPSASSFTIDLLYPDTNSGTTLRSSIHVTHATIGGEVTIDVARGSRNLIVFGGVAVPIVDPVPQTPLRVLGAAQDMHLDPGGHVVSLLFNRPVTIAESLKLRDLLALTIHVDAANYSVTRRNNPADPNAELQIPAAVRQNDARLVMITLDKTLHDNADYLLAIEQINDLVAQGVSFSANDIVPRVDNDIPAAILTGKVLLADNTPVAGSLVKITLSNTRHKDFIGRYTDIIQYDISGADGRYLFEFVPRDLDRGLLGKYSLLTEANGKQASLDGSVRIPGAVHYANLVFLGSGTVRGQLRWDTGEAIPNWKISGGSALYGGGQEVETDAGGNFELKNMPVGPATLATVDPDGRMVYATAAIRTAGEVVVQDLIAIRREGPPPGTATVRLLVLRSDTMEPVSGADVGVGSPQVPLWRAQTGPDGRHEFRNVPAGLMSIIAADFSISRHGAAVEVELRGDQILEQTLVLQVGDTSTKYAVLHGTITRDDPAFPGDVTKDQIVPGAVLNVYGMPAVIGNADGTYTFPELPTTYTDKWLRVFDPATNRTGWFKIPTLFEGDNNFPIRLKSIDPFGRGTYRVRLYGAKGEPVTTQRVFIPGFPADPFTNKGGGVYELPNIRVPMAETVWAVTSEGSMYGDQFVKGTVRVDFGGQIGITDLRLPGSGSVVVKIEMDQPCSTPPCYSQAIGPVSMTYMVWDDFVQKLEPKTIIGDPDPVTGLVTFPKVPARQEVVFKTHRHPAGFAAQTVYLGYDGDARSISLRMSNMSNLTGRVLAHDGITPLPGASVRITTGTAIYAPGVTKPDGTFLFAAIPADKAFKIVAEIEQDGIFRTGIVEGKTPAGGGPVSDLVIVMRQQSEVEGRVVNNADGTIVPLANFWLRELSWPYRTIGTPANPLQADINGRFVVSNVFTGPFRITAVSPQNQEVRGDYQGTLLEEGDVSQRDVRVRIGDEGTGTIAITVVDPLLGFEPVANAEVALRRAGNIFDFTTTNDAGVAYFEQVPAGTNYTAFVFSKQRGRSGQSTAFSVFYAQTTSVSVQLDFLGVVSGSLTDPDREGAPARGQPVTYEGNFIQMRATTDTNGNWEIGGVPEGPFMLSAWELETQRIALGPANLFISKLVPEQRNIHLELERMGTLTVKVYLPNDTGGPGELAPLVEATAVQCTICNLNTPDYPYFRSAQGNPIVFPRMFRRVGYSLSVRELGGEARNVGAGGKFPANALEHEHVIVLPQSGTVEITVLDGTGVPVADAEVVVGGSRGAKVFTGPDGKITLPGSPFGGYWVTARKGNVSAAASGTLANRSIPLKLTLNLGTNITITGHVEAEAGTGQPSPSTRVVVSVSSSLIGSLRMETFSDANGDYAFSAIPVGNTVLSLLFFGPDDTTIGANLSLSVPNGTTGTFVLPSVKLDATPPRVLSIDPPANSTNVSPASYISVTFSEPIKSSYLNINNFDLIATDDSSRVQSSVAGSIRPDGTYVVRVTPPAAPPSSSTSQKFPLKSNVLYRFSIRDGIEDTTGNRLKTQIGTSFTTVDYTEPAVVKITPVESEALPQQATFKIKFNKAIDVTSYQAGNGGLLALEELDAFNGQVKALVPISTPALDVADPTTVMFAPVGVAINESSFYRVTVRGTRDTAVPPNVQIGTRIFNYFSFDLTKPVATIVSPVPDGQKLVSGILYSAGVSLKNEGSGTEARDIAYVDWLDAGGVSIARVKTAPFAYSFVAPSNASSFTLKATATDLSGNTSTTPGTFTWEVAPNAAPTDITVTNGVASAYPSKPVETRVTFKDEGVSATVVLEVRGTALDGTDFHQVLSSKNVTRASSFVEFPEVVFNWNVPLGLKDGTARVIATVTDSANNSASGESSIAVLLDQTDPAIVAFLPMAESRYKFGVNGTYTIELQVKDLETGIARAVFTVSGAEVFNATSGTYNAATGLTTFKKTMSVPPKNADTRVPIVVTAYDQRGRTVSDTHEVIYERVDDESLPRASWITPLDGAALPSNASGWETTLRVKATDDVKVTSVRFVSPVLPAPIELTAPKAGTTDIYEAKAALAFPADGSSFTITAIVADGDPAHDVELPIAIDPFVASPIVTGDINITNLTASQYADKSVLVRGNVKVYVSVPLTVKDLVLVDGAMLSVPEETRLDLTVTDRLFVDADSRVDVSDRGWLGGRRVREDNSFMNPSYSGRTVNGGTGATSADGSHAGIGGGSTGLTNATYGSITDPVDFGSGGGAQPQSQGSRTGGNGGGALALRGGRFVLAGPVRANGGSTSGSIWSAGAGGSIDLRAHSLITSVLTRITANGGDAGNSTDVDLGGGGGRIAVRVTERLDVDPTAPVLQARGGRNTGAETPAYVEGGAGTIYLARPSSTLGELVVSSYDERNASTAHRTNGTPLAGALSFDAITVGPRALARFDVDVPANVTADATATVLGPSQIPTIAMGATTPAAGSDVPQNGSIATTFTATSSVGVREVRTILSVQPADVVSYSKFVTSVPSTPATITVPHTTAAGSATLKLRVTDRSGRTAETEAVAFNVVANTVPIVDTFDVNPNGEIYANRVLSVTAAAHDDLAVKSLTLATSAGTITSQSAQTPTPQSMTRTFTVNIPPSTPSNSSVVLTLSASDEFPGRAATTQQQTLTIKQDLIAPSLTIAAPAPNQQLNEGSGATFVVSADASDAEVAVQRVVATFEGVDYQLALTSGIRWTANIPLPSVDGTEAVAKNVVVRAYDYDGNFTTRDVTFNVLPLIDPNALALSWVCGSSPALYPAGYEITFKVLAMPNVPANDVKQMTLTLGTGTPVAFARTTGNEWQAKATIPTGTAGGTVVTARVLAISQADNESTLLSSITVVGTGTDVIPVTTNTTVFDNETVYENKSFVVYAPNTLTVRGAHTLGNVVVLSGGKLVQDHVNPLVADELNVARLYVECGGAVHMNERGFATRTTYPGAGVPDINAGGSHIGRGGPRQHVAGGAFGSVLEPKEPGGGGLGGIAPGGGAVRIRATGAIVIDGDVLANGKSSDGGGAGGSVWLATAGLLAGAGKIEARGGPNGTSAGGGGAIALDYASTSGAYTVNASGGSAISTSGPGTIVRRVSGAANGQLLIDSKATTLSQFSFTELPAFGQATVASRNGSAIVLGERRWVSASLTGHRLRAYAPDGSVRGTYRLAGVTNHPSAVTVHAWAVINTTDSANYSGYLLYAPNKVGGKSFVAVRRNGVNWEYDTDSAFAAFTPAAGDVLFATFTKSGNEFQSINPFKCGTSCGSIDGIPQVEVFSGELIPDMLADNTYGHISGYDPGELIFRPDTYRRAIVLGAGAPTLTLETLSGTDVQPGDRLRGFYRFDDIKLVNARVVSEDLIESVNSIQKDAASTLQGGNLSAPVLDPAKIRIAGGLTGPLLIGSANAVTDTDTAEAPFDLGVRYGAAPVPPLIRMDDYIGLGTTGGFSVRHGDNATVSGYASTIAANRITGEGYVAFTPMQANAEMQAGLAPNALTASYNEAQHNSFRLKNNGTYEIWANAANTGKTGTYTVNTPFRMEKTATAIRWFVDDVQVHEMTTNVPPAVLFKLSTQSTGFGELASLEFVTTGLPARTKHRKVGADGSFRIPLPVTPGQSVFVRARDAHAYSLETAELELTVPNTIGVASVTFAPPQVLGSRTAVGTVTLLGPAGDEGALVTLQSNDATVTVPASITVPPGASSATFNATTVPVLADRDVTVTATYNNISGSVVLPVLRDTVLPAVTITAPAENAEYTEGDKFFVRATVVDEDTGVKRVWAEVDGQTFDMALSGGVWSVQITTPYIDGSANIAKDIVVRAEDFSANVGASAPRTITVKPIVDANPPSIAWNCGGSEMLLPVGYNAPISVIATPPNATNIVGRVDITFTDAGGASTTFSATQGANNVWSIAYPVPDVADGSAYTIRAVATTAGGTTAFVDGAVMHVVKGATEIRTNTTITSTTTTYDNKSVVIWEGATVTIDGTHPFQRLIILGTLTHAVASATATTPKVDVTSTSTYVGCTGTVDVLGMGYNGTTFGPGATNPTNGGGGSHLGRGGLTTGNGTTFGSVNRPLEPGGGGYQSGSRGGGIVHITGTTSVIVDGTIRANGANTTTANNGGGAGGSVWITAGRISGNGQISANGGDGCRAGGGGAISVEYTDGASSVPPLSARAGTPSCGDNIGGPGTVRVSGPGSPLGDLTIDSAGFGAGTIELPSFGNSTTQAGTSGATFNRGASASKFYAGHWVRVTTSTGTLRGTWRIAPMAFDTNMITLLPNGTETISLAVGDKWQGIYRFDSLTIPNGVTLVSNDPIETTNQTISAPVTTSLVRSGNLRLTSGAKLTNPLTNPLTNLTIEVSNELRVDSGAAIDVTGLGYTGNQNGPGAQTPPNGGGGAHVGRGGLTTQSLTTFGSVYRPLELGGGGYQSGGRGGGVARITAGTMILDGAIRANGDNTTTANNGGGAGGSVWVTAGRISGTGSISANGGDGCRSGGGGAISIDHTDATSVIPSLSARTGTASCTGANQFGGPGTMRVSGPSSPLGDVTIDSAGFGAGTVELPSFGTSTTQAGTSGATFNRGASASQFYSGHWVRVTTSTGTVRGTWRIAPMAFDTNMITLLPNGNETISLAVGDKYQGIYRFDSLTVPSPVTIISSDPIETTNQTISAPITASSIKTDNLRLSAGATLSVPISAPPAPPTPLTIDVANELRIDAGAAIEATGAGYPGDTSSLPGGASRSNNGGGSHIGRGGLTNQSGTTFGSVSSPAEMGAGGYQFGGRGGGTVRITASSVILDGTIRANGANIATASQGGGAGGSVWITAGRISGQGAISVNGGDGCRAGGGGAISIEYTDGTSSIPPLSARAGTPSCGDNTGGPGTMRISRPGSPLGDVTIDSAGFGAGTVELPSFGAGTAGTGTSGPTFGRQGGTSASKYYSGHWVRVTTSTGTLRGTWRIAPMAGDSASITLLPNGSETISLAVGDKYQGVYRFDSLTVPGGVTIVSADPIETTSQTISAPVTTSTIKTDNLRLGTGATLSAPITNPPTPLTLDVANELRIDAGAAIDVTGAGYAAGTTLGSVGAASGGGGSHFGRGGLTTQNGATYGNVSRPAEMGAGGAQFGAPGGGVVRITASALIVDGAIRASGGIPTGSNGAGAGGSVWVNAGRVSGQGSISADGGDGCAAGGGGAISIVYTDATSQLPARSAKGGIASCSGRGAGAGTIFRFGPDSIFGEVVMDNTGRGAGTTELPSFGTGTTQPGTSGATFHRSSSVPTYWSGHWVRITAPDGTVRGTWRVAQMPFDWNQITLLPNGTETISILPGDTFRGVYRFDTLTKTETTLVSNELIEVTTPQTAQSSPSSGSSGSSSSSSSSSSTPDTATVTAPDPITSTLAALTLEPTAIAGTGIVNAVVTLSGEAPLGGALVTLTSSDPRASVPETIIIPAGATSALFTIATPAVEEPVDITITATWGVARSATLQLLPAAGGKQ